MECSPRSTEQRRQCEKCTQTERRRRFCPTAALLSPYRPLRVCFVGRALPVNKIATARGLRNCEMGSQHAEWDIDHRADFL